PVGRGGGGRRRRGGGGRWRAIEPLPPDRRRRGQARPRRRARARRLPELTARGQPALGRYLGRAGATGRGGALRADLAGDRAYSRGASPAGPATMGVEGRRRRGRRDRLRQRYARAGRATAGAGYPGRLSLSLGWGLHP